ncbi:troponin C-like [Venturia canescens]|uniref:troponin C-like n=1 Tax=Venturia canescens TaxID=32260 RepID=UPI001C9C2B8A|nr:troponin C-like [Venturia canescens]
MDQEGLTKAQQAQLRMAFDAFDQEKTGKIPSDMLGTILGMMGKQQDSKALAALLGEIEPENEGELNYEEFTMLASRFLEEDVDTEAMQQELREAFRLYDREGNGYITTEVFRDILHELDENLTDDELDMMIDEIDADGSGTLDFDEFVEAMTH